MPTASGNIASTYRNLCLEMITAGLSFSVFNTTILPPWVLSCDVTALACQTIQGYIWRHLEAFLSIQSCPLLHLRVRPLTKLQLLLLLLPRVTAVTAEHRILHTNKLPAVELAQFLLVAAKTGSSAGAT